MAYTTIEPSSVGTIYSRMENPGGWGDMPFGDPPDEKLEKEFGRGFGDPSTTYTDYNEK